MALLSIFLSVILMITSNTASIVGTWHINNEGYPLQTATSLSRSILVIKQSTQSQNICDGLTAIFLPKQGISYTATITHCSVTQSFYINNTILFNFCVDQTKTATYNCFEGKILEGIMSGHQCNQSMNHQNCSNNNPNSLLPFSGWNQLYFDTVFPLRNKYNASKDFLLTINPLNKDINNGLTSYCHLRIDYNDTNKQYIGRYKIFHQMDNNNGGEQLEYDLKLTKWNGTYLEFMLFPEPNNQTIYQIFKGNIQFITLPDDTQIISRDMIGIYTDCRYPTKQSNFTGIRWNILSPGLVYDTNTTNFILWQNRTRTLLKFLMMFGNPEPLSIKHNITKTNVSNSCMGLHRDDNCNIHPQNYEIYNVTLYFQIPNWYNMHKAYFRKVHGFMAFPFDYKNVSKFVLSVNGHSGSSYQMMFTPNGTHDWYGDAYTRRDYIELSIDISHRNTTPMYHDKYNNGDDPKHDNGPHPAIRYFGENDAPFSDFEEDGERVWDAIHATKWFFSSLNPYNDRLINIDDKQRYVTGHSMGGEITTFIGALFSDDLFHGGVIPGGFSPDLDVMYVHGNHPCWRWMNANIREHIDTSILHGLIVPRLLIVETGQQDTTYSNHKPPYSADKQVMRRTREYGGYYYHAMNGGPFELNIFHYLHYDVHHYHVGDIDDNDPDLTHLYVQISNDIKPHYFDDVEWEIIANTSSVTCPKNNSAFFNLFDLLNYYQLNQTRCS